MALSAGNAVAALDRDHCITLLRAMLRIRRFEEKCAQLYSESKIRGFLHLYVGEEAVAAGAIPVLQAEDAIVSTYREHGHALARGVAARAIMAEMYGKQERCSRGRGGSMHLFDAATRFYGGNAIVGGGLPPAVGLALADRLQGRQHVTACFFGEGAIAEGNFTSRSTLLRSGGSRSCCAARITFTRWGRHSSAPNPKSICALRPRAMKYQHGR
jgi:pyruvate dehydrogenase E1 component alpha subunit